MVANNVRLVSHVMFSNVSAGEKEICEFPPRIFWERVLSILLVIGAAYLLASLLYYSWKNRLKKDISKINHLTVLSALCALLLSISVIGELWVGVFSCFAYHWFATAIYTFGIMVTYTVLWARQRKMYSDKLLGSNSNRAIRIMSNVIICCIYCTFGINCWYFTFTYDFECKYFPCVVKWIEELKVQRLLVVNTCLVMSFVFQSALFLLLVHPITREKSWGAKIQALFCSKARNDLEKLAKRLGFCACACIVSSGVLGVVVLINTSDVVEMVWCNLATLDLLTNTLATVVSFVDWKHRLFSLFLCPVPPQKRTELANVI